jgi:hypothetical protein
MPERVEERVALDGRPGLVRDVDGGIHRALSSRRPRQFAAICKGRKIPIVAMRIRRNPMRSTSQKFFAASHRGRLRRERRDETG